MLFDSQVMAFTLVRAVLAVTPGADTLQVLKNSVSQGNRAGWLTTLGILTGTSVHAVISALGISVIVTRSDTVFQLIKGLGALYLVWLGIQAICYVSPQGNTHTTGSVTAVAGLATTSVRLLTAEPTTVFFDGFTLP